MSSIATETKAQSHDAELKVRLAHIEEAQKLNLLAFFDTRTNKWLDPKEAKKLFDIYSGCCEDSMAAEPERFPLSDDRSLWLVRADDFSGDPTMGDVHSTYYTCFQHMLRKPVKTYFVKVVEEKQIEPM